MDIQKKKAQAKKFTAFQSQSKKLPGFQAPPPPGKITGFQFTPWNPAEVLITSADSRIGIYNGPDLVQKIRGFRNTSSQISASFCPDGKHIISASEDSQVYIWKVEEPKAQAATKKKTVIEVTSHENFSCKDVSVAITWPGSTRYEPPPVDLHPKKTAAAKKPPVAPAQATPPLTAQDEENPAAAPSLPPLPKKKKDASSEEKKASAEDQPEPAQEETGEAAEASTSSVAAAEGETQAPAENASSSSTVLATAWGLVIVTASLEGEIKVYQNFGLPVKVARLF